MHRRLSPESGVAVGRCRTPAPRCQTEGSRCAGDDYREQRDAIYEMVINSLEQAALAATLRRWLLAFEQPVQAEL